MATSANAPTGPSWLHARIAAGGTVLLDGGTGTELERRGVLMNQRAWCGDATLGHREILGEIHQDYIRAGAEVIITNTFATAWNRLDSAMTWSGRIVWPWKWPWMPAGGPPSTTWR